MHTKCWNTFAEFGVEFEVSQAGGELLDVTSDTGENAILDPTLAVSALLAPATEATRAIQGNPEVVLTLKNSHALPDYDENDIAFGKLTLPMLVRRQSQPDYSCGC